MDFIPEDEYFQMPPDTLEVVRKDINMEKPGMMKEAVRILDEWVKQQPHFMMKTFPLQYLEASIVMTKGSIEQAKKVIENMCTMRTLRPQYFEPGNPREYYNIFKNNAIMASPMRLSSEYHRLIIMKLTGKLNNDILNVFYKFSYHCLDYTKARDYSCGLVLIFDLESADLKHVLTQESYGMRVKRLHLITPSKLVHSLANFFKPFVSKKIFDRVMINTTVEELQQYYDKDALPKDYGGNDKTILELQDKITQVLCSEKHLKYMARMFEAKIDESLRPLNDTDEIYGTFRSLSID